jgi:DNA-binding CsgD family transcriptional regulator
MGALEGDRKALVDLPVKRFSANFVDRIYEAAVVPDRWPSVLDELNEIGDGYATFLFGTAAGHAFTFWIGSERGDYAHDYIAEGWPTRTDRATRLLAARHAGFLGDLDVYTREEMDREPVFTDFLRPRGLGWGIATGIPVPTGETLIFDVERRIETGPVDRATVRRLDRLRPHLARASLISTRLSLERAHGAAMALDLLGLPAAVLGQSGRALAANPRFERLMPHVVRTRKQRLQLVNAAADVLFADALARLAPGGDAGGVRSIPIPAAEPEPPMIVHLLPVRGAASDVFTGGCSFLVVTPVVPREVPTADVLQGLFDLTPAEARVARAIAERNTIEGIASSCGLSQETIRSQLKAVLAKTGLGRQADLTALLAAGGLTAGVAEGSGAPQ